MKHPHEAILNPLAAVTARASPSRRAHARRGERRVIGLLDNSKPNVATFLRTVEEALRARGDYDFVTVPKPRSAGPAPDLPTLSERCDFVINAVAD